MSDTMRLGAYFDMAERELQELSSCADGETDAAPLRRNFVAAAIKRSAAVPVEYHLSEDPDDADLCCSRICRTVANGRGDWFQHAVVLVVIVTTVLVLCALTWPDAWR